MHSIDPQQKVNAKRCIMTILPTVPGPVVDYALNTPFFASIISAPTQPEEEGVFTCRKMNSGDFGELSVISPKGGKHLKIAQAFVDSSKMCFSMEEVQPNKKPQTAQHQARNVQKLVDPTPPCMMRI